MITLLHGNDEYLIKQEFKKICKPFKNADIVTFHDQMNYTSGDIVDECNMLDLFGTHKIIKVQEPSFLKGKELGLPKNQVLFDYLKNANPDCELIFICSFDIDKRTKIGKEFLKYVKSVECNHPDAQGFRQYVLALLKQEKVSISRDLTDYLIDLLPNDMNIAVSEIKKLALYPEEITKDVLTMMINRPLDDDVFHLSNALVEKNMNKALSKWKDLRALNQDPIGILLILANQIRFMYQVKVCMDDGKTDAEIASYLKAHPYRVQITHKNVNGVSANLILKTLNELSNLDQSFKKGLIDPKLGLEKFIINYTRVL